MIPKSGQRFSACAKPGEDFRFSFECLGGRSQIGQDRAHEIACDPELAPDSVRTEARVVRTGLRLPKVDTSGSRKPDF
jgi:hypothetical protein